MNHVALPSGLQTLKFGDCFNKRLSNTTLPSGLQTLKFGEGFGMSLSPVSYTHLTLPTKRIV